jgi:hypothetical protein
VITISRWSIDGDVGACRVRSRQYPGSDRRVRYLGGGWHYSESTAPWLRVLHKNYCRRGEVAQTVRPGPI